MSEWKKIVLYAAGVYLTFICAGLYLAHGGETPPAPPAAPPIPKQAGTATTPKEYVVPTITRTDAPQRIRESKSCREYLTICERSCADRGDMFKFACIGQEFQPFEDHYRCTCADDLFARREVAKQIQVKREGEQ